MRTLALSVLTMVTVFGATAADAQRLGGGRSFPGASYPVPGGVPQMQQPGGGVPVILPPPPQVNTMPRPNPGQWNGPRPTPGQWNGQRPNPGQMNPQRPVPGQWNAPRPNPGQWNGPRPNPGQANPQRPVYNGGGYNGGGSRWGGSYSGRWSGGWNAPGGWNAYRRPTRGYRLPSYWISPNFFIGDFGGYGLYAPPQGYGWQRYYDDAVLVDPRGRVRDSVYGVNWDGGYGYGYSDGGYAQDGYSSVDYGYGQGYAQGGAGGQGYGYQTLPPVVQNGGVTTYSTSNGYSAGGYASGGYYYPGATTTVVTIQGAPSVTTTTTEYIEETRTRYVAPRKVYRAKKVYRPRCVCRRPVVEKPVMGS